MSDSVVDQILRLAEGATAADGVAPFGEQPLLALRRHRDDPRSVTRVVKVDGVVAAVALWSDDDPDSIEVATSPDHRRQGLGAGLVREVLADRPHAQFWAHGKLPGAQAVAQSLGLQVVRELWRMEVEVGGLDTARPGGLAYSTSESASPTSKSTNSTDVALPEGYTARAFQPSADEEAWLRVNARAFATHPEQGRMTRADLDARMAESWFDPEGLILVEDDATGEVVASHWTKIPAETPQIGEVYVVGVDPAHQGRGLGRPLTALGLTHLVGRGVHTVELYVEADNAPAVTTYRKFGFEPVSIDAMYAAASETSSPAVNPGMEA